MRAQAVIPVTTGVLSDDALSRSIGKRIPCSFLASQVGFATLTKVSKDAMGRAVMHLTLDLPEFDPFATVSLEDGEDEL